MLTQESYVLFAKIDNAKNVLQLLKAINFREEATIFASAKGLKVTVDDSKSSQSNAFIQADMFQEYEIDNDMVTFKISLSTLVECLSIFGNSGVSGVTPALKIRYNGHGFPLTLLLEEAGVITDCRIKTLEPEDTLDFNFTTTGVVNKIIMRAECLKEIFSGLDTTTDVVEIFMSPDRPYFRLTTFGNWGKTEVEVPRDCDVIETFSCNETSCNKFKWSLLKPCIKPLATSQKVSIRTDRRGFLCLQFLIKTEDNHTSFVEHYCSPELQEDD